MINDYCQNLSKEEKEKPYFQILSYSPDGRFSPVILRGGLNHATALHEAQQYNNAGCIVNILKWKKNENKNYNM